MLEVKHLVKRYGQKTAVDGISFSVARGEIFGLLGPNGAGKSTTINIISGLLKKDGGTVTAGGLDIEKDTAAVKRLLGVVPQDLAVYQDLSALENLRFFGSLYGLSGKTLTHRAMETLAFVGLSDRARDRVKTYSGGMKRRLNIACSLLHRPDVLILDEPTVGIDPQSRNHIFESIRALNAQGTTIVYTTHYMEEAQSLCRRIAVMDVGRIVAQGDLHALRQQAGTHRLMRFALTGEAPLDQIRALDGVASARQEGGELTVHLTDTALPIAGIVSALAGRGLAVTDMAVAEPNLEDIFLKLTGKRLRD